MASERGLPTGWWTRLAEPVYSVVSRTYHHLHDHRRLGRGHLERPVISVGNLAVGGTGKTPAVAALVEALVVRGLHPAILTRGYGGNDAAGVLFDGERDRIAVDAETVGDEPLFLSRALPGIPVVLGRKRASGARHLLETSTPVDLFVLDDGFQHRELHRDCDLVLIDADTPLGNGRLLPAGPLREGPGALARANHILVTGADPKNTTPGAAEALVSRYAPSVPVTRAWTVAGDAVPPPGMGGNTPAALGGKAVYAVAGIARPERFRRVLADLGAEIRGWKTFPDHHAFTGNEVAGMEKEAAAAGARLITTTKDMMRLEGLVESGAGWLVLPIKLEVDRGWNVLARDLWRSVKGSGGA